MVSMLDSSVPFGGFFTTSAVLGLFLVSEFEGVLLDKAGVFEDDGLDWVGLLGLDDLVEVVLVFFEGVLELGGEVVGTWKL